MNNVRLETPVYLWKLTREDIDLTLIVLSACMPMALGPPLHYA